MSTKTLRAFLSYTSANTALARAIATALTDAGIDVWWAEWEITAGDSLRRKIDAGLSDCTHFIVLLTPESADKPWVNAEIDAAFVGKLQEQIKLIPLRNRLSVERLPPLLRGLRSPEVDDTASNLSQLINDLHGVSAKPALGKSPLAASVHAIGFSKAATAIARVFVESSEHGLFDGPELTHEQLQERTGLTAEDVRDGLHDLGAMVRDGWNAVLAKDALFATFDALFCEWNPEADARRLAADLVNDEAFPRRPAEIAARYGWKPRRLNPAITWLTMRGHLAHYEGAFSGPWVTHQVSSTDATRRFLKSRA